MSVRFHLQPVEQATVVKAGPRLLAVRKASAEHGNLVDLHDPQISQGEVLQIDFRLAEIEVEQEFQRENVIECDEVGSAAMFGGNLEWNMIQEVVDQLRFRPGNSNVRSTCCLRGTEKNVSWADKRRRKRSRQPSAFWPGHRPEVHPPHTRRPQSRRNGSGFC